MPPGDPAGYGRGKGRKIKKVRGVPEGVQRAAQAELNNKGQQGARMRGRSVPRKYPHKPGKLPGYPG